MPNPHAVRVTLARRPESDDKVWYPVPADIADQLRGFGWAVVEVMPVFEHKTALEVERRRTGLALGIVEKIEAEVADARKADAEATENVEWSGIDLDAVDEWAKQLRASLDAGESGQLQADPGSSKGLDREALTHDECEALLKLIAQARDEADPDFEMPPALRSAQLRLRGGASGLPVEPSEEACAAAVTVYDKECSVVRAVRAAYKVDSRRVDAQPEREDGEVEALRAMLAEARKESGDAQIERDEEATFLHEANRRIEAKDRKIHHLEALLRNRKMGEEHVERQRDEARTEIGCLHAEAASLASAMHEANRDEVEQLKNVAIERATERDMAEAEIERLRAAKPLTTDVLRKPNTLYEAVAACLPVDNREGLGLLLSDLADYLDSQSPASPSEDARVKAGMTRYKAPPSPHGDKLNPVNATFRGGVADGRKPRLVGGLEAITVYRHRQNEGVVEFGEGQYGGRSDDLWQAFPYRRTEHGDGWATYEPADDPPAPPSQAGDEEPNAAPSYHCTQCHDDELDGRLMACPRCGGRIEQSDAAPPAGEGDGEWWERPAAIASWLREGQEHVVQTIVEDGSVVPAIAETLERLAAPSPPVELTVEEAKALKWASVFGSPPDPPEVLKDGRRKLDAFIAAVSEGADEGSDR